MLPWLQALAVVGAGACTGRDLDLGALLPGSDMAGTQTVQPLAICTHTPTVLATNVEGALSLAVDGDSVYYAAINDGVEAIDAVPATGGAVRIVTHDQLAFGPWVTIFDNHLFVGPVGTTAYDLDLSTGVGQALGSEGANSSVVATNDAIVRLSVDQTHFIRIDRNQETLRDVPLSGVTDGPWIARLGQRVAYFAADTTAWAYDPDLDSVAPIGPSVFLPDNIFTAGNAGEILLVNGVTAVVLASDGSVAQSVAIGVVAELDTWFAFDDQAVYSMNAAPGSPLHITPRNGAPPCTGATISTSESLTAIQAGNGAVFFATTPANPTMPGTLFRIGE
jgi:hypothetical protein